jgi:hypothetical protein
VFATALASQTYVNLFLLLEIGFDSGTAYYTSLAYDVVYGGNTYLGVGGLMKVSSVTETPDSAQGVEVTFTGSRASDVSTVLTENVQNRPITIRFATLNTSGAVVVDTNVWSGKMDYMEFDDSRDTPQYTIKAEHYMIMWDKAKPFRYTDSAQQWAYPGDLGLQYVAALASTEVVWPNKEAFKV